MKKTGQLLKDKRESAKLSLSEVALATKINPKILTAIENGDEKGLPAKTFLRGFLRSYALYLKMDVDEVLRSYQEEMGGSAPAIAQEAPKVANPTAAANRRAMDEENSSGLRTAAVVVIVVLIGAIVLLREIVEKYQREKTTEGAPTVKVSPLAQPPAEPVKAEPAKTEPTKTDVAKTEAEPIPAPAVTPAPVPAPAPAPVVAAQPIPAPVAVATPEEKKAEEKPAEPKTADAKPEDESKAVKATKNEIILEALDKVDVKFQIKGETKKLSLAPTQVHTIFSDQPVTFDFSDGGAVNIILNGRERGTPGDLGKPKQVQIP